MIVPQGFNEVFYFIFYIIQFQHLLSFRRCYKDNNLLVILQIKLHLFNQQSFGLTIQPVTYCHHFKQQRYRSPISTKTIPFPSVLINLLAIPTILANAKSINLAHIRTTTTTAIHLQSNISFLIHISFLLSTTITQ